jgi:predicted aspartyl protease
MWPGDSLIRLNKSWTDQGESVERVIMRRLRVFQGVLLVTSLAATGPLVVQQPTWVSQLGYRAEDLFTARRGLYGMPFVEVSIAETTQQLLFDTGNTVGLTLATSVLDRLNLPVLGRWDRLDSDGRVIGTYRRVRAPRVRLFGRTLSDQTIFEFSDPDLVGLVGPDALPGTRFTLDYRAEMLAITNSPLEAVPPSFTALPLTHSARHPRLILATGRVNGRAVLMEFDTGASRTNVDPQLVRDLSLPLAPNGVRIDSLEIGHLIFAVPSAKVNPKSGIDPTLALPIQVSVGSDILARIILTVDFARGQILVSEARRP